MSKARTSEALAHTCKNDKNLDSNKHTNASAEVSWSDFRESANLESSNSKIVSEKCGLQEKSQGSLLDINDRRDFLPLPHLSPQAELPRETTQNLASIPNVRILEISSPLCSYENLGSLKYEIFLQNCIGDYLLFMDLKTDSIDDCLSMLSLAPQYDMVIGIRKNKKQNILQKLGSKLFYKTLALFANKAREDYSEFCVISRKVIHTGIRKNKKQNILQKLGSKLFYKTLALFANKAREDYSEFCVISRKVIHTLLSHKHDIKLLRLLHFDTTLNICEYPYTPKSYPKRKFLDSLFLGLDVIFGESYKLLRLGTCMCLMLACGNALYALYILSTYFFLPNIASGWTSTSLYMVAMNMGLFLMLSIIGEYVRIALIKLKGATPYEIVNETSSVHLNFENKNIQRH